MLLKIKLIITTALIVSSTQGLAQQSLSQDKVDEILQEMSADIETKKISVDLAEKQLKNVLLLESSDPSRSCLYIIMDSYLKHKGIFEAAVKKFSTREQNTLNQLLQLIENLNKNGNG